MKASQRLCTTVATIALGSCSPSVDKTAGFIYYETEDKKQFVSDGNGGYTPWIPPKE